MKIIDELEKDIAVWSSWSITYPSMPLSIDTVKKLIAAARAARYLADEILDENNGPKLFIDSANALDEALKELE